MVESDLPDDDTFDQKLRDGTIHPDMQRKDAGRRPVENLAPIRRTGSRGEQVSAISARRHSSGRSDRANRSRHQCGRASSEPTAPTEWKYVSQRPISRTRHLRELQCD
jgi:hypothetical protein